MRRSIWLHALLLAFSLFLLELTIVGNRYVEALETRISKIEDLLNKVRRAHVSRLTWLTKPQTQLQSDNVLVDDDAENVESSPSPPAQPPPRVSKRPHTNWPSSKAIYPRGVHPATDSSEEVDPSDNEEGFGVTDVNFKGYTGKSSNFDLVRTVIDMKSVHKGCPPGHLLRQAVFPDPHPEAVPTRKPLTLAPLLPGLQMISISYANC